MGQKSSRKEGSHGGVFIVGKKIPYHWIDSCLWWRAEGDWDGASRKAILDVLHAISTLWSQRLRKKAHAGLENSSAMRGESSNLIQHAGDHRDSIYATKNKLQFPRRSPIPRNDHPFKESHVHHFMGDAPSASQSQLPTARTLLSECAVEYALLKMSNGRTRRSTKIHGVWVQAEGG